MGGSKGSSKGPKKPFSELSEEKKEEIRAKHEEVHAEQGRELASNSFFFGEVLQRGKRYGWIKPSAFGKLPADVQKKVKDMVKEKKQTAKANASENPAFNQNVLFIHMSDVEEAVLVQAGDKVKFKVYTDTQGAGACEVSKP